MSRPALRRKVLVDVVQGHGRQFLVGIFQQPTCRIVDMQNLRVWTDPQETLDGAVDGELSQLERFLGLPQHGDVFVEENRPR